MSDRLKIDIDHELSDAMLFAASDESLPYETRIGNLARAHGEFQDRLTGNWTSYRDEDPGYTATIIHTAMAAGVTHSLAAIIEGAPQDYDTARTTNTSLRQLCELVVVSDVLNRLGRPDHDRIRGAAGELAVLTVMWDGIQKGRLGDITHVLPAARSEDQQRKVEADGIVRKRPYTYEVDLTAHEDDPAYTWPIQVESKAGNSRRGKRKGLHPDITPVYVHDLRRRHATNRGETLLDGIVEERDEHLEKAADKILTAIVRSYSRKYDILEQIENARIEQESRA